MPKQLTSDLWCATLPERGTRYFRSLTMACLWLIDPDNPAFAGEEKTPAL